MTQATHPPVGSSAEACAACAAARGCDACFEELVRQFQTPLLHFLIRRTGSRHDAEDLVQETFVLAYRNIGKYRSTWRFSTWLFTIANRAASSSLRRRKEWPRDVDRLAPEQSTRHGADPMQSAATSEMRSALWDEARAALLPDSFTALWLSYVESMPAEEIGQVLGRNANAVRILLSRARTTLAERLDPEVHGPELRL